MFCAKPLITMICAAAVAWGCAENTTSPVRLTPPPPETLRPTVASFGCAVIYDAITQTNEAELTPYGVEPATDTARVCEAWTGNDYSVEITQIGSSEPASDYAEDVMTTIYQSGVTSAYDAVGSLIDTESSVGATSFEFVAATAEEQQASYSEPYYAVIGDPSPTHCSNPPCADMNVQVGNGKAGDVVTPAASPIARRALRHLIAGKTEIVPSVEGFRRFRRVETNGDETVISVDPVTELIRRHELKTNLGTTRADLTWSLVRGKFVRDRMDVVSDETIGSKRLSSRTTVLLRNVYWNPALVK